MRRPYRWAALVAVAAVLTGCGDQSDVAIVPPSATYWPWETSPPTPVAVEAQWGAGPVSAAVVLSPTPAPTEDPEPTETPEPDEDIDDAPEPEPSPEPSPTSDPPPDPPDDPDVSGLERLAAEVVRLTNAERTANGCPELTVDDRLQAAAQGHSEDMAARNYFSHESPEGIGPGERARNEGYNWFSGENIAMGQRTAESVVDAWMNSEGHRRNILNCSSVAIGVGVAEAGRGYYWTQKFGRR